MGKAADIDDLMYSCGLEILHPGGLERSLEMAAACGICSESLVLDIGSGKGATAASLAEKYGCRVTSIDQNPSMISYSENMARARGLSDLLVFLCADAYDLPFPDESFDIVIAECSTVLLDRKRVYKEMLRLTRPVERIGDLEMTWRRPPPPLLESESFTLWEGFSTMTLSGWENFFEKQELSDIESCDFSFMLGDMKKRMFHSLGPLGLIRLASKLTTRPPLLKSMLEYNRFFRLWDDFIGYGWIVGRRS